MAKGSLSEVRIGLSATNFSIFKAGLILIRAIFYLLKGPDDYSITV